MSLLLAAATIISAGQTFGCTPTRVWDGGAQSGALRRLAFRLPGIGAREADGSCRRGQPCPSASAEALVMLLCGSLVSR
jgi:hypothetical protein